MYYDDELEREMIEDMERVAAEDFLADDLSDLYPDDPEMIGIYYVNPDPED